MKPLPLFLLGVVVGAVLAFILLLKGKGDDDVSLPLPDTVVMGGDTVQWDTTIVKPVPYFIDTGRTQWLPVDTFAILLEYFYTNYYHDTLKDDTSALIVIDEIVNQNKLNRLRLDFVNRRPTQVINVFPPIQITDNGKYLDVGAIIGRSAKQFGFGPSVVLRGSRFSCGASYDIINKDVYLNIYKPLYKLK